MSETTNAAIKAMEAARNFPENTCGASRHAGMIAEDLIAHGIHEPLDDDPGHCGESIAMTVAELWSRRSQVAALTAENEALRARLAATAKERDKWKGMALDASSDYCDVLTRLATAEARAEQAEARLREYGDPTRPRDLRPRRRAADRSANE